MSRRRRMTSKSLLSSPVILYAAISLVNRGSAFVGEILFHKQGLEYDIMLMSFDGDTSVKKREVDSFRGCYSLGTDCLSAEKNRQKYSTPNRLNQFA